MENEYESIIDMIFIENLIFVAIPKLNNLQNIIKYD